MLSLLSPKTIVLLKFTQTAILLFAVSGALAHGNPWSVLWTTPSIIVASLLIAWGAESAQFFVAQGFALAILAWMQTIPEFAVEAVLALKGERSLLLANLTGALRLLTGLAWPIIYATAAIVYKNANGSRLKRINLAPHQSVEVIGLAIPLLYGFFIWWKGNLEVYDAVVLVAVYAGYLLLLSRLPPEKHEAIEDLEAVPRRIVLASRSWRTAAIAGCFLAGGSLVFLTAEPFLASLIALAAAVGIPTFFAIQWLAPVISEFPELASTFYFARQEEKASMALMNIVSSNINQLTLLVAMLPIALSFGSGHWSGLRFDPEQSSELLLTLSQALVGLLCLVNMQLAWWEALLIFVLFAAQFVAPGKSSTEVRRWLTFAFFLWSVVELFRLVMSRRQPAVVTSFLQTWRAHVTK